MRSGRLLCTFVSVLALLGGACTVGAIPGSTESGGGGSGGAGGKSSGGGSGGSGGSTSSGGTTGSGGQTGTGGSTHSGGATGSGGKTTGGTTTGGTTTSGGTTGSGGQAGSGGSSAAGGAGPDAGRDGPSGSGGIGKTGGSGAGGKTGSGGASSGGATAGNTGTGFDCNTPMPTSGGKSHSGNSQGGSGNLAWQIWSNQGTGTLTTFDNITAFSASWNNSGNYLGRMGYEWGNSPKDPSSLGKITAEFAETKTGNSGNQWSYVGIYGWSNNPCVEWYIIDDSYSKMPINPGNCNAMSGSPLSVDDGKYTICTRNTSGTGGDRCGGASSWIQYYSIRQTNRTCGTISVTDHFNAWAAAGNKLGKVLEVKILLEVGGGQGSVDFPVANVVMEN